MRCRPGSKRQLCQTKGVDESICQIKSCQANAEKRGASDRGPVPRLYTMKMKLCLNLWYKAVFMVLKHQIESRYYPKLMQTIRLSTLGFELYHCRQYLWFKTVACNSFSFRSIYLGENLLRWIGEDYYMAVIVCNFASAAAWSVHCFGPGRPRLKIVQQKNSPPFSQLVCVVTK